MSPRASGFSMEVLLPATCFARSPKGFAMKLLLMCAGLDHRLTSSMSGTPMKPVNFYQICLSAILRRIV
ncbi:hypothetical protein SCLCIDRAFT_1218475 [Scleroderma citrinum Foug A]|uniref:Uncharacterized protein n=1 Tax=Scleroderma citrinum Foug A TaxID=1036808 RepID=A0A0C3DCS7_9AGAM|nr:hypothetical protein SCLCIDRAFT_1218475 [Scleroderma citrinum Foug A]